MYPAVQKILEVISNQNVTFFIPPYQRNYEWTYDQCKVFLDDIVNTAEKNMNGIVNEHFFGSITYFTDQPVFGQPTKLILIDGQQRITTTMLFLIALRDIITDENKKEFINDNFIKNSKSTDSTEYKIKLKQVESDWDVYKHIALSERIEASEKHAFVYKNYQFFKSKLVAMQKNGTDLLELVSYGLNNFSVATLQLQPDKNPWENPQEIFESMNSIGKPLSLADLVRNYLLLGLDATTQDRYYKCYWLRIEKTLSDSISSFIRDYMQCVTFKSYKQSTETNYKELYSQFKEVFAERNAEELLSELANYSEVYAFLVEKKETGLKAIDKELDDIRFLNVSTAYSFLMLILDFWKKEKLSDLETCEVLKAFKIYISRRRIMGLASNENKVFPIFASKFEHDVVNSPNIYNAMFKLFSTSDNAMRLPNDNEMKNFLLTMNFYNFKYCKFFLAMIEESITKSRPDMSDPSLQIEHIMPQTLSAEWKQELGENFEKIYLEKLNTIGNLTLIRHNQELGNKSFQIKKEVYESKSGLQIARKKITDCAKWNEQAISERSDWIVGYLLDEVLSLPEEMKYTNNFVVKEGRHLSFLDLQLIGEQIHFIKDPQITAKVVDDKHVEFEGKNWTLSRLTREIQRRKGNLNKSGTYSGTRWWGYEGIKLDDII